MTKRRIIGCLLCKDDLVVQSIGFERYLPVGKPEIAARYLDAWGVDEIILLDIDASRQNRLISTDVVERVANAIHCPLTVGGGIRKVSDVVKLTRSGADKISINDLLHQNIGIVPDIAARFGVQCIVGCIDVVRSAKDGEYSLHKRTDEAADGPLQLAQKAADLGVGELLVNCVHRDGHRSGYDVDLIETLARNLDIPVIALGGAGHPDHVADVLLKSAASAAAIGNMLHYTEHAVSFIKARLINAGLDIRYDSKSDYRDLPATQEGRVGRQDEDTLLQSIFDYAGNDVI